MNSIQAVVHCQQTLGTPSIPLSTVQHVCLEEIDHSIDAVWEAMVDNDVGKTSLALAKSFIALVKLANECNIDLENVTQHYIQNEQAIQTVGKEKA